MAALVGTSGSDTLLGDAAADVISGLDGNDTLYGGAGSDTLEGGLGADRMFGGDGIDTATYANSAAGVTATLGGPVGSGGDAQGDVLFSIENLLGSALGDRLTGSAFGNRIEGGAGNDTLIGGGGADQLFGGAGTDRADYTSSGAAVTVALGGAVGSGGDAEGDRL